MIEHPAQYRFLWGLNWVILGLAVQFCGKAFCLPIDLRLYRKKESCQKLGRPYQTRSELMRQVVAETLEAFPERPIVLVVDGHFATKKLLRNLPRPLTVITRLRRDAAVYAVPQARAPRSSGRPRLKGKPLSTPERIAARDPRRWRSTAQGREVKTLVAVWYGAMITHRVRIVVARQKDRREPYAYLLCTDPEWEPGAILSTYARRWSIEITIREAKQHTGLGDAQCRVTRAVERQHAFTLAMMTLLMGWLAEGHLSERSCMRPWYRHKRGPTFLDMLAHARWWSIAERVLGNLPCARDIAKKPQDLLHYIDVAA